MFIESNGRVNTNYIPFFFIKIRKETIATKNNALCDLGEVFRAMEKAKCKSQIEPAAKKAHHFERGRLRKTNV